MHAGRCSALHVGAIRGNASEPAHELGPPHDEPSQERCGQEQRVARSERHCRRGMRFVVQTRFVTAQITRLQVCDHVRPALALGL